MFTQLKTYKELEQKHEQMKSYVMKEAFAQDPKRFEKFSLQFEDILFDYSKNIID